MPGSAREPDPGTGPPPPTDGTPTRTPEHFREHFDDAAAGTVAEGADVEAELATDPTAPDAPGVGLESIDIESEEP